MEKSKLVKLFEMQNVLRDHIGYEGEDKKDKMLLALLVEIGECANEWKGFKYWSKRNKPNTFSFNKDRGEYNPLLDEYVDGFHFVMDYGLEIGIDPAALNIRFSVPDSKFITQAFLKVQEKIFELKNEWNSVFRLMKYELVLCHYLRLGKMLGFSDDDIFNAYVEKNKINHQRQDNGY